MANADAPPVPIDGFRLRCTAAKLAVMLRAGDAAKNPAVDVLRSATQIFEKLVFETASDRSPAPELMHMIIELQTQVVLHGIRNSNLEQSETDFTALFPPAARAALPQPFLDEYKRLRDDLATAIRCVRLAQSGGAMAPENRQFLAAYMNSHKYAKLYARIRDAIQTHILSGLPPPYLEQVKRREDERLVAMPTAERPTAAVLKDVYTELMHGTEEGWRQIVAGGAAWALAPVARAAGVRPHRGLKRPAREMARDEATDAGPHEPSAVPSVVAAPTHPIAKELLSSSAALLCVPVCAFVHAAPVC